MPTRCVSYRMSSNGSQIQSWGPFIPVSFIEIGMQAWTSDVGFTPGRTVHRKGFLMHFRPGKSRCVAKCAGLPLLQALTVKQASANCQSCIMAGSVAGW